MRVAGGDARGLRLKGAAVEGVRPTTERVRAAIFNVLHPELYQGERVLDLYAGSGSLGIEALSMGAAAAVFVERDRRQCGVIRTNLENTGFGPRGRTCCAEVNQFLSWQEGPFPLVMLDPPYRLQDLDGVLEKLVAAGMVAAGGTVVVGHSRFSSLLPGYGTLSLESHRRYGDNVVDFFRQGGD
jgi:16S rRNA (guanine(966)-N(2))-methyltransferase RsmD